MMLKPTMPKLPYFKILHKKPYCFFAFLLFLLFILFASLYIIHAIRKSAPENICIDNISSISVYFCPRDNCSSHLLELLNHSISARCAFYDINDKKIISFLNLSTNNIDLIVDDSHKLTKISQKFKARIHYDTKRQLMHNKFCIFNNTTISTGSYNPTFNGNKRNNNNLIIIRSRCLAGNYDTEFQRLWKITGNKTPDHKKIIHKIILGNITAENYFCPEDDCRKQIINHIDNADKSIYFMLFSFTDKAIADAIISKNNLDIKGLMEKRRTSMHYNLYSYLKSKNITLVKDKNIYIMHHKVIIIDNKTVITGSYNPTLSAAEKNYENILIIRSRKIAEKYLAEFNMLLKAKNNKDK